MTRPLRRSSPLDLAPWQKVLAYVPDDPKLFDALTVFEHLRFIASAYHVTDFEPRAERLLEQFELTEQRHTLAQELSRGMRQKVAICCACERLVLRSASKKF